jgi:hypothetical protein
MTKKISTPTNPPLKNSKPAWNRITGITATALRPSISARYFIFSELLTYIEFY